MKPSVNKNMLFDHFAGKSTPLQKRLIEEWLQKPENKELFYLWLLHWEQLSPQYIPELSPNLALFKNHITQQPLPQQETDAILPIDKKTIPLRTWKWLAAACAIVTLLGIGSFANQDFIYYKTYRTAYGETKRLALEDGSKVFLNANSSLRIPRFGFGENTREVFLKGEAAFSVSHTIDNQKFIVKTDHKFNIVVLGTEFTVFSRERGAKVALNKGKVQLHYQVDSQMRKLMMKPGELITLDKSNLLRKDTVRRVDKFMAWKDHQLIFEDTSLQEFREIMFDNYGLNVILANESLAKRTLVGSFNTDNAEELLYTVAEIFDLKVSKSGNNFILSKK